MSSVSDPCFLQSMGNSFKIWIQISRQIGLYICQKHWIWYESRWIVIENTNNAGLAQTSTCPKMWKLEHYMSIIFCQKFAKYNQLYNFWHQRSVQIMNSSWKIPVFAYYFYNYNSKWHSEAYLQCLLQPSWCEHMKCTIYLHYRHILKVVFKVFCQLDRNVLTSLLSLYICHAWCFFFSQCVSLCSSAHPFISILSVKLLECRLLVQRVIALGSLQPRPDENNSRCWFTHVTWAGVALFTYISLSLMYNIRCWKTRVLSLFSSLPSLAPALSYSLLTPPCRLGRQSDTIYVLCCLWSVWPVWTFIPYCRRKCSEYGCEIFHRGFDNRLPATCFECMWVSVIAGMLLK